MTGLGYSKSCFNQDSSVYASGFDLISAPKDLNSLDEITFKGPSRSNVIFYPTWEQSNAKGAPQVSTGQGRGCEQVKRAQCGQ